ncbi:hypothetical protein BKA67DRAFT_56256 [Truncatella angustata]|uniref:Uncharacterized protein n=1 Tax=Truncatella angustata TaxID=152316 RepID=A0A9P8UYN6_9PEZI|nr:uncharacterized protein BKA67DRAFT_56256 [Truncatella angustata]KAH6660555.1 hypothetical protein BKA67DRAFT_56256 [Truncatella angustata]
MTEWAYLITPKHYSSSRTADKLSVQSCRSSRSVKTVKGFHEGYWVEFRLALFIYFEGDGKTRLHGRHHQSHFDHQYGISDSHHHIAQRSHSRVHLPASGPTPGDLTRARQQWQHTYGNISQIAKPLSISTSALGNTVLSRGRVRYEDFGLWWSGVQGMVARRSGSTSRIRCKRFSQRALLTGPSVANTDSCRHLCINAV